MLGRAASRGHGGIRPPAARSIPLDILEIISAALLCHKSRHTLRNTLSPLNARRTVDPQFHAVTHSIHYRIVIFQIDLITCSHPQQSRGLAEAPTLGKHTEGSAPTCSSTTKVVDVYVGRTLAQQDIGYNRIGNTLDIWACGWGLKVTLKLGDLFHESEEYDPQAWDEHHPGSKDVEARAA